jgi:hypothetical protein
VPPFAFWQIVTPSRNRCRAHFASSLVVASALDGVTGLLDSTHSSIERIWNGVRDLFSVNVLYKKVEG